MQQEIQYIPTSFTCSMVVKNQMDGTTTTNTHQQFIILITFRVQTVDQLQEDKKAVPTSVQNWNIGEVIYDSE